MTHIMGHNMPHCQEIDRFSPYLCCQYSSMEHFFIVKTLQ